jgi:DNA-binding MurR/RpiR family transcriptional regulator
MDTFLFPCDGIEFTKTELQIRDYIYQNLFSIPLLSIEELAACLHISTATISRFAKHCGCADYKSLRNLIANHTKYVTPSTKIHQTLSQEFTNNSTSFLLYQRDCIEKTALHTSEETMQLTASAILNAKNIYLYGKGVASCLVSLLRFRLMRMGKNVIELPVGSSELFEYLVHTSPEDLVIIFGFQRIPLEGRVLLEHAKTVHYKTLLISSQLYTKNNSPADFTLYVYRGNNKEYHSLASSIALIDALVVSVAQLTGDQTLQSLTDLYQLKEHYKKEIPR